MDPGPLPPPPLFPSRIRCRTRCSSSHSARARYIPETPFLATKYTLWSKLAAHHVRLAPCPPQLGKEGDFQNQGLVPRVASDLLDAASRCLRHLPQTRNPKPDTPDPRTPNPKPRTPDSQTPNPQTPTRNPIPQNLKPETPDPQTRNPEPKTPKPQSPNLKPQTPHPKPKPESPNPKTQFHTLNPNPHLKFRPRPWHAY